MSLETPRHREGEEPVQVLDTDGRVLPGAESPDLGDDELLELYAHLKFARRFDERAVSLQRQGRIGTYAPMRGQEAAQVGSAFALADADWLLPTYRDHAAKLVHGKSPTRELLAIGGHPDGYAIPDDVNQMPEYIPIGTQVPQAAGIAWAKQLSGDTGAVLCYLGDGATSEGDVHAGMNFAGVFDVPVVFFCNNNQWAISMPRERQTASRTIAQKAHAYGFDGVQVDGMDPLAVYKVTTNALGTATDPAGDEPRPTLIEAIQYRLGAHSTADDPSVYRREVPEKWTERDPVPRFEAYLRGEGLLDDERVAAVETRVDEDLADALDAYEATEADSESMFRHVYAERTPRLDAQREQLRRHRERHSQPDDR